MTDQEAKELLQRYENNLCTPEEEILVESWYLNLSANAEDMAGEPDYAFWNKYINEDLPTKKVTSPAVKLARSFVVAASIVVCLGVGVFIYRSYNTSRHLEGSAATRDLANDIKPGTNKAILTLSNGSTITLTDAANGALAKEAGVEISKTDDERVVYTVKGTPHSPQGGSLPGGARDSEGVTYSNALNTIETPRGGQYQVRLPDGSKVWLNAASKLVYPVTFNGREDRRVELSGEAYFEIAKDKNHPFKVKSNDQEVEVLGTHFNINSYADEANTKTTLLEGSVKVTALSLHPASLAPSGRGGKAGEGGGNTSLPTGLSPQGGERDRGTILKPGQQSSIDRDHDFQIKVQKVQNLEMAVAWKNGSFYFADETLEEVMKKIARWYDLEVVIQGNVGAMQMGGMISRKVELSKVLGLLEATTSCDFKIDGRKVTVSKKRIN